MNRISIFNLITRLCCSALTLLSIIAIAFFAQAASADICWKDTSGRGVGTIPNACPAGYSSTGFGTCAKDCPSGYRNDGLFCAKPSPYGRGAGYAIWSEGKCKRENSRGCEKNGLLWYPKCKPGFHAVGCCICSPDCPAGMNDIGVSCTKPTKVAKCPAGKSKDAGLCYGSCPADSKAIGPVCWGQCPSGMTDCGAMCGGSTSECLKAVWDSALAAGKAVYNIVKLVTGDGKVEEGKADPKKMKDAIASTPGKAKEIATTISQAFKEKKISFADLGDKAKAVAQLGKDQYDKLIAGIGGQENLKKLIEAGKNPSDIDGLIEVVKGLDPIGLADFAGTLKKPICGR